MRTCKTCGIEKDTLNFTVGKHTDRRGKTPIIRFYTRLVCKSCVAIVDREKQIKRMSNPEIRKGHIERLRNNHLIKSYGITIADKQKMIAKQGHQCALCSKIVDLVIDHDHKTGKIRALLCQPCNKLLGCAFDDICILEKAITYLKEHNLLTNTQQA